jgi:hypothetical protein
MSVLVNLLNGELHSGGEAFMSKGRFLMHGCYIRRMTIFRQIGQDHGKGDFTVSGSLDKVIGLFCQICKHMASYLPESINATVVTVHEAARFKRVAIFPTDDGSWRSSPHVCHDAFGLCGFADLFEIRVGPSRENISKDGRFHSLGMIPTDAESVWRAEKYLGLDSK